jgi:hypothetical protein
VEVTFTTPDLSMDLSDFEDRIFEPTAQRYAEKVDEEWARRMQTVG